MMTETDNVIVKSEECIFMCLYGLISAQIICVHSLHEPSNPSKVGYSGHSDNYIRSVLYNYQQQYHKITSFRQLYHHCDRKTSS